MKIRPSQVSFVLSQPKLYAYFKILFWLTILEEVVMTLSFMYCFWRNTLTYLPTYLVLLEIRRVVKLSPQEKLPTKNPSIVGLKLYAHSEIRGESNLRTHPFGNFSKFTNFTLSGVSILLVVFPSFFPS